MGIQTSKKRISLGLNQRRIIFFLLALLFFAGGVFFTHKTCNDHFDMQKTEALLLADSSSSLIPQSYLKALDNNISDLDKKEYLSIKNSLIQLVKTNNHIGYAYFVMMRKGIIVLAVDSYTEDSDYYYLPGQECSGAEKLKHIRFHWQTPQVSKPYEDDTGRWISVTVPVTDADTGEILAIFGLDYPANQWNIIPRKIAVQSGIFWFSTLAMLTMIYMISSINTQLRRDRKLIKETDNRLKESMTLYKGVFDQTAIGIAIADGYNYILETESGLPGINAAFENIMGRTKEEIVTTTWVDLTNPEDLNEDIESFQKFKSGLLEKYNMEKRFIKPDGEEIWVHMTVSPLYFEDVGNKYHLCTIRDISKRKQIEKSLLESERSYSLLLDNTPGMIYRCKYDRDWTMLFVSKGCFELTGYQPESLINNAVKSYNDLIAPEYREIIWQKWSYALSCREKFMYEYEIITASGETKWISERGQGIYDELGNLIALEGLITDISAQKEHEEKIKYINNHYPATGLFNQKYLIEKFSNDIAAKDNSSKALLVIRIRKYNLILTTYGYSYCKSVIKNIATHLTEITDDSHILCQLSMDKFALYVKNFRTKNELVKLCDRIIKMLSSNTALKAYGAWVGVDIFNKKDKDIQTVLKNATMTATLTDAVKPFGYSFYDTDMESDVMRQEYIKDILARICDNTERDSFYLEYQPIINRDGSIHAFEALARIKDKELGNISPIEFIDVAKKRYLIVELGRIILDEACGFIKKLQDNGWPDVSVAVNISEIQLSRDDFLTDLKNAIDKNSILPENLILEIAESGFADNLEMINNQLTKAQILGIRFAIDDFGTGYSSLAKEHEIAADIIKIDKFFIDQLLVKDEKELITSDIINLAHKMGQKTVAECIEYPKQLEYLKRNNCDYYQGFLFSKPVAAQKALELLESGKFSI